MEDILVHLEELKKRKYKLTDSQRNRLYTVDKDVFIDVMNYQLREKPIRAMGFSLGRPRLVPPSASVCRRMLLNLSCGQREMGCLQGGQDTHSEAV